MTDDPAVPPETEDGNDPGATRILPGLAPWVAVAQPQQAADRAEHEPRRLLLTVALGAVVALVVVSLLGVAAARTLAERQAVNTAANTADLLSEAVVQPVLQDGILTGDADAVAALTDALREYINSSTLVRVKLWDRDGRVLYSDEPRLIGKQFELGEDQKEGFVEPRTRAEVSTLDAEENGFERDQGRLLEAYRPVWTPSGTPLLFETYAPYDEVDKQASELWRGFAGLTVSSLLLFTALLVPLLWRLLSKAREAQRQREALLQRAVDASADERQRIAGTLHDGVVQELAATSFAVSGAAARAAGLGDEQLAADLQASASTLRDSIGGLRTLLVDIYPETLRTAGLLEVLNDLAATLRSRDIAVHLDVPVQDPGLGIDGDRLVFRIVHECLQNVRRHSAAENVWITLRHEDAVIVEIADDGVGFDPAVALDRPESGHFGLRLLVEVAVRAGARLEVSSAPGAGCRWRLTVPPR